MNLRAVSERELLAGVMVGSSLFYENTNRLFLQYSKSLLYNLKREAEDDEVDASYLHRDTHNMLELN